MKMHIHILCIASAYIFTETIETLQAIFESWGYFVTTEYAFKKHPHKRLFSKYANIVFKAQRKFDMSILPERSTKILFQTEQFSKLRQFDSLPYKEPWDLILDVFSSNVRRFPKTPRHQYLPIGYHSNYGTMIDTIKENQDVYFFGAGTKSRRELWRIIVREHLTSRFANTDLRLTKMTNIYNSKVNLFMSAWEPYFLPMMHCIQILARGKFLLVVTENPDQDYSPFKEGLHFVAVREKDAMNSIEFWVRRDNLRKHFAQKAYKSLITNHPFEKYLKEAMRRYIDVPDRRTK